MTDVPVIILCGGQGTRIRDVSENIPKPMLPIGGLPILWHIMRIYSAFGYRNFILALGHKGWLIKEYFLNFKVMTSDFALDLEDREVKILHQPQPLDWHIIFAETGEQTQTGKRVLVCEKYVQGKEFMVTYGDGVANVDVAALHRFHRSHGRMATVTGVRPSGRFGAMTVSGTRVVDFNEKQAAGGGLINGGFFVFNSDFFDILRATGDTMLETVPIARLVEGGDLQVYDHSGFWEPMDTMREYVSLNRLWESGEAPWKVWP